MELLFAISLGVLVACAVYLLLRAHTFPVIVGLTLLSYAVNLFLFGMARLRGNAPIIGAVEPYTDPVPQALVLTAIVIGFAMTAFSLVLALRAFGQLGHDRTQFDDPAHDNQPSGNRRNGRRQNDSRPDGTEEPRG